jgi:hypothetical protein
MGSMTDVVIGALVAIAFVVVVVVCADRLIGRVEDDDGHLGDDRSTALHFRVPVGLDAASAVVSLHRQGYEVTTRYDHGETRLYIRTVAGTPAEREIIRSLIYDADRGAHEGYLPPAPHWHPGAIVFEDESPVGRPDDGPTTGHGPTG